MPETQLCAIGMDRRHRYISSQTRKGKQFKKFFRVIILTSFQLKWLERLILCHVNEDNDVRQSFLLRRMDFVQVF